MRIFEDRFEFCFLPESLLHRRPDLLRALLPGTSLIHSMNESGTALLAEKFAGESLPPVLTWIHHVTKWSPEHDIAARHSAALIACTPEWERTIREINPHPLPIHVIRHGVDTDLFYPIPGTRARYGIAQKAFVVGFVAHRGSDLDNNRKGFPVLMEIVKSVGPRIPNFHLLMLGPGWEEPVRELKNLGIQAQYIKFLPRSGVPGVFSAMNAYLLTSRVEGGPCTILEAMACGTPAVATQVGLVPDVIENGLNGFSAPVGDAHSLGEALLALASDADNARKISTRARATVTHHSWTRNLAPLGDLYLKYLRPVPDQPLGAAWMRCPDGLTKPAHAADVIVNAWDALRKSPARAPGIVKTMLCGLEGLSAADMIRGAALLKGLDFRA
ncbi:MAG: glycosyltransferase family 4 protein [Acidobacteriota bacterium]|nr:glycosyltransferase family 4 protein [Acidobacteriota bacterium]